ncbi:MAG: ORF6N domain-containing protein [Melioribacteraceae bacterium]
MSELIKYDNIIGMIFFLRGEKVILDRELAKLYQVDVKVLNQAVKRNISRFPDDFMFRLTTSEYTSLRSQFVTLKRGQHRKYLPYAFTEQGVAILPAGRQGSPDY